MSKKSRKRNRKIIGALGALGLGLALANRNKGTGTVSTEKTIMDNMPKKKPAKVYKDAILRGDAGVKYSPPNLKFGQVIDKKGDVHTLSPWKNSGLKLGIGDNKVDKTQAAVNKANKEMASGMLPPQLRTPGRTNITTAQGENRNMFKNAANWAFPKWNLKSGGRAGHKSGGKVKLAKRGLGRAFTKSKK